MQVERFKNWRISLFSIVYEFLGFSFRALLNKAKQQSDWIKEKKTKP